MTEEVCQMVQTVSSIIGVFVAIISLVVAVFIPVWIMHNQRYENLLQNYLSTDFAAAIKSVVDFFKDDCNSDVNQIADAYKERFEEDFKIKNKTLDKNKQSSDILHYQRIMLNNFFWGLSSCTKQNPFLRHKLKNEFTKNEAYICKILIYMNLAVDSNPEFFKDVSDVKYEPMPKTRGMSSALNNIYEILKDQSRWIK